ncbi:MAG: flagellar biosynthesis protein FlhB [Bdellovibrionota bacterium]
MSDEGSGEKSEQATDARREDYRKRGQVAHTKELASALILMMGAGLIYMMGKFYFSQMIELFDHSFGPTMVKAIRQGEPTEIFKFAALKTFMMAAPVAVFAAIIGSASSILQIGFLSVEEAFSMDVNKLNPIEGLKRLFSFRTLIEGGKSIMKIVVLGMFAYMLVKNELHQIPYIMGSSISGILTYIGHITVKLLFGTGVAMLVIALADYFLIRWDLEKKMMMTKQEVKEEHKQREGDPLMKSRIRKVQRDLANKRMMDAIPKADVVITNPTHIAVVLKYGENLPAPQVVAKGADLVAERIKALAKEHGIPIVENKPLARAIFKTLKIGQVIPRELFVAVAEVLSYVYRLKKKVMR